MTRLFVLTCAFRLAAIVFLDASARADEPKEDLARLQGTWKGVEIQREGRRSSPLKYPKKLVFHGDKLYESLYGLEQATRIKLNAESAPKAIDLTPVVRGYDRPEFVLLCCYRLDGNRLSIARGYPDQKERPRSLDTANDKTVDMVTVYERESDETAFPEKILREFDVPKIEPTKNHEADAAVREMLRAVGTKASVQKLESLVTGITRRQLEGVLAVAPGIDPEQVDKNLKRMVLRDARVGERIIWADGSELVVKSSDIGPDETYLMMTDLGIEQQIIRLVRDGKRWKVDLGRFLREQRAKPIAFEGIRFGMSEDRVRELLEQYRTTRTFKKYELVEVGDGKLAVDCDEGDGTVRHVMHFRNGVLSGCEHARLPIKDSP